ncbi:MAG: adenylate/guanylate cyclase domain-containing protein [Spirochaetaceae bacterium]|nr:adenylate/guanylate cyclase domain-containing protein [Spirochaetaceae bacterium]
MRNPLARLSLAIQILFMTLAFIGALMGAINAVLQRAVLEGSTKITVEVNESMIKGVAERIGDAQRSGDLALLEKELAAVHERNEGLESLFVSDGRVIIAASEPGKSGMALGGGSADRGAEIRAVIAEGVPKSEIEQRTDIVPRLTYIYPVSSGGRRVGALVAKFSLEKEFGAIVHLREALFRILAIAGVLGVPALFGLLWLMAIGPLRRLKKAAVRLSEGDFDIRLRQGESAEMVGLSLALLDASASIKAQYERYLSPQVVALLQKEKGFLRDIRMRTTASVLMCDIEGFTSLSEGMDVNDLGLFLSDYFRAMTEIIFKRNGTLDKYMGDGILAIFGAPMPTVDFRSDAIEAAIEMTKTYGLEYRAWLPAQLRASPSASRIRVGIASGELFYGNVGYEKRSDFTALGRAVNLASRLQELNKETGTAILIDEETAKGLAAGDGRFTSSGSIEVRGLSTPVPVMGAN